MNTKANNFDKTQKSELDSWFSDDSQINRDKRIREIIRYPLLRKQMGLDALDTSDMHVYDIGCGPFGGVSTVLKSRLTTRIDPLIDEYKKNYPIYNGLSKKAEDIQGDLKFADLIIITNALDHFDRPQEFLRQLYTFMKPGAYVAMIHAIDNAYSHPHEAHAHNVNPEVIHEYLDKDFEFVWELDYAHDKLVYGWRKQPAHAFLARKVSGYVK
jgi:2-polyprenyl-3-methyl-5-hydroxy-6-metoxy-1,4-benzoquinol methylase